MTPQDLTLIALTCWREARGGRPQPDAMQAVVNVIMNRAAKTGDSPYTVCTRHAQFSSISVPGPEAALWPVKSDPQWLTALSLALKANAGALPDITEGSLGYYALTLPEPPYWAATMQRTVTIGGQVFMK